ncbi:MAG: T9SS C-terminal target domain-containing protein, partial [Candidatus Neomarinimicrobiota bacterium]
GTIYGWDVTGTPATDFPIVTDSVRAILCADVLGDERREIIGQKRSGEIIIWDASGKVQLTFGIDPTDTLIQVAQYQGQSILLCRQSAWIVEDSPHELDGWWALHQNLYRIRSLSGAFPEATGDETLLIQSQTYAYPNPAREGKVTLRFTVGSVESVEIEVFTLSGHFLRRWKISHPRPRLPQEIHWDVRGVTSGVYFAKVYATSGTKTESKILKIGILN